MNACAKFFLTSLVRQPHADGESDKLIASVTKQAASQHREWSQSKAQDIPAADLCKMLSHHQGRDKASVMINGVEYVAKVHDVSGFQPQADDATTSAY
jgi:hypothetical protein